MLNPGEFNQKIRIDKLTTTQNSYGEPVKSWTERFTVWASKRDVAAGERFRSSREISDITARFTTWYNDSVLITDRIYFDSKYWDIIALTEIGYKEGLQILAEVKE